VKLGDSNSECLGKLGSVQTNQLAPASSSFQYVSERQQLLMEVKKTKKIVSYFGLQDMYRYIGNVVFCFLPWI
jgi:hypothetical protein